MKSNPARSRRLLVAGFLIVSGSLGWLALHGGRISNQPAPGRLAPPTAASVAVRPGIVCRSTHYTLTAEIHAGF